MIGTVICRNCDTAIEVSEGDVTRFRASPTFACSVCKHDLSQRMAELLGRASDEASEEPTVPDDDAYEGLPVSESLDQAAARMRGNPEPTPVTRTPEPTPTIEDPTSLALRIAQQAQAQAQALVAQAIAKAGSSEDGAAGMVQAPSWRGGGGGSAMAAVAPVLAPDAAATAPGSPETAAAISARVGVVPEEPENEPTRKRGDGAENTESTGPGAKTDDTVAEESVTVPGVRGAAMPEAPVNERTPSISSRHSPFIPEEPPREVTIRKHGAPAPPAKTVYPPRTGTGPTGIGALGIRVIFSSRAVVRPVFNGRPSALPSPAAETQISQIPMSERVSGSIPATPAAAPWKPTEKRRRAIPLWALFAAGGGVAALVAVVAITTFTGGDPNPKATPMPTATGIGETTATPIETAALGTPTSVAATPTPKATATVAEIMTPTTPVSTIRTPIPTPTALAISTSVRTPTPAPTAARTPTDRQRAQQHLEKARRLKAKSLDQAIVEFNQAMQLDPSNKDLHMEAFTSVAKGGNRDYARKWANEYVEKFGKPEGPNAFLIDAYRDK